MEIETRLVRVTADEEKRRDEHLIDSLNKDLERCRLNESNQTRTIDELKQSLSKRNEQLEQVHEQLDVYLSEIDQLQRTIAEETDSNSRNDSIVNLLKQQNDEKDKRLNALGNQLNEINIQSETNSMIIEKYKAELSQTRFRLDESLVQESVYRQERTQLNQEIDEKSKLIDERQREVDRLNEILSSLQFDYEQTKEELSAVRDKLLQAEIDNQTLKENLNERNNEFNALAHRFHQGQEEHRLYEKEHRFSNEQVLQREQHSRQVEEELKIVFDKYRQVEQRYSAEKEQFDRIREEQIVDNELVSTC